MTKLFVLDERSGNIVAPFIPLTLTTMRAPRLTRLAPLTGLQRVHVCVGSWDRL